MRVWRGRGEGVRVAAVRSSVVWCRTAEGTSHQFATVHSVSVIFIESFGGHCMVPGVSPSTLLSVSLSVGEARSAKLFTTT